MDVVAHSGDSEHETTKAVHAMYALVRALRGLPPDSSFCFEHITPSPCTAALELAIKMKSAFARLHPVAMLLALDSRDLGQGEGCADLVRRGAMSSRFTEHDPAPTHTQVQRIPERVHRSIPCMIRCPFLTALWTLEELGDL